MSARRICFIGNSHVGPLAVATRETADLPFTTTFLYAPGMVLMDLAVQDGELVPTSDELRRLLGRSGGTGTARLDEFDAYLKQSSNLFQSSHL